MTRKLITDIIAFLFTTLLVYAAATKLFNYQLFTEQLRQSPLLFRQAHWVAWTVPAIELAVALLFAFPRSRKLALFLATALMSLFTFYIIAILYFSPYVPCSCGGILEGMGWIAHLAFNIAWILLGVTGVLLIPKQHTPTIYFVDKHARSGP